MLEYGRTDISEGTDIKKTDLSKECVFFAIGILKISVLNMNLIFVMDVMIQCKNLWVLIILLLYILREVLIEFIFSI